MATKKGKKTFEQQTDVSGWTYRINGVELPYDMYIAAIDEHMQWLEAEEKRKQAHIVELDTLGKKKRKSK